MTDIHDIKGLVPLPQSLWWLWLLITLAIVALAVWWWWRRRRRPAAMPPVMPPLSPYDAAILALQQLWGERPDVEVFYTQLSDIVRHYLEGRFQLRAPERTTEEFLYEMARDHTLSPVHQELLGRFLQESDLVKFAKHRPESADLQRAFEAARAFVEETRPGVVKETVNAAS